MFAEDFDEPMRTGPQGMVARAGRKTNGTDMKDQAKNKAERLGVTDFLEFMYDGEPEWALFAVKAPIEQVSSTFADFREADNRHTDVPHKAPDGEYDDIAGLVSIVQVKGNPWTVVYRSLLYVDEELLEEVAQDAKELSRRLKTRAISFVSEDASGAMGYELFEDGSQVERAVWEVGGEFSEFESKLRKQPDLEEVGDEFVDEVFRREGIYLPYCYPKAEADDAWIAVEKVSADAVERADLIDLGGEGMEEDEEDEG